MEELITYRKSIINRSFWIAAGFAIVASVINHKDYSLGIIIGVMVSAVNFLLLSFQVAKLTQGGKRNPFFGSFLMRYGLLAICLYAIMKYPQVNIFGFLIGYFILQLNLFIATFMKKSGVKVSA